MKNWKTTIVGILGAIFTACLPLIQTGAFDIHKDWPSLIQAAGIALLGYLAKDFNVSGTGEQPKN